MYLVTFSRQADKDKKLLKSAGLDKKAKELLNVISGNPFQNPPPYEKSVGNLSRHYSRRVNLQHRIVDTVADNTTNLTDASGNVYEGIVFIKRMWTHYE